MSAPRRRGRAIAAVAVLVVVTALAVPLAILASARTSWEAQNADLRDRVDKLTDELSARNATVAELEGATAQLERLKEEYSSAVNQGSRGTELVTELEGIVEAYQQCVAAQTEHFEVLRNAERYVASSVDESERSIVDFCAEVTAAYVDFQAQRD